MFGLFTIITFPMSGCCTASEQFFGYIMVRTSYIRIDDDVLFVLEQQAELDLYSASSLMKQQRAWVDMIPNHQSFLSPYNAACLVEKQQILIL